MTAFIMLQSYWWPSTGGVTHTYDCSPVAAGASSTAEGKTYFTTTKY
uniref:Uncharacterized protein n=1 Tax=Anguilla anguilla TaxID=7936 RepID=A0A0E9PMA0_ANGAN